MNDALLIRLRADDGQFTEVTRRAAENLNEVSRTSSATNQSLTRLAAGSGVTRNQMQQLNYTLSDTVSSLASNISPVTILLQQGPQLVDAFGGVNNTFRGLLGLLNPVKVGLGALAVVAGALGFAAFQGRKDWQELQSAIVVSGNAAGVTGSQIQAMADRVSSGSRQTISASRQLLVDLVQSGRVSSGVLESTAQAVAAVADATGRDAKTVVREFLSMGNGVARWAAEHNKAYNFISGEQFRYIQRLEQQGQAERAAVFVNQRLIEHLDKQGESLGYLDRMLNAAARGWSRFWAAAKGVGAPQSSNDRMQELQAELAGLQGQLANNERMGRGNATIAGLGSLNEGLRAQIRGLNASLMVAMRQVDEENLGAERRAQAAKDAKSEIDDALKPKGRARKPEFVGVPDREIRDIEGDRRRDEREQIVSMFRQEIAEDDSRERRLSQMAQFSEQVVLATEQANVSMIASNRQRGLAVLELERRQLMARVQQLATNAQQRRALEDEVSAYVVARQQQLTEELKPEWQRMLEAWDDTHEAMRRTQDQFLTGFVNQGRSAFEQFNLTGRISATGLVNFMRAEFARMVYDRFLAGMVANVGNTIFSAIFGSVGGGGGGAGSAPTGGSGLRFGGGAATGSNYIERDMLTILHKGEAVIPQKFNPYAGGGGAPALGGGVVINQTFHVAAGVDREAMATAAEAGRAAAVAQIAEMVRRGNAAVA